jgi:glycosyltransferase involved in cell wall biosynthesis
LSISVVIPTFNRADLLGFTLDAVLAQTHSANEIIVVDDGSTDATEAVLSRYAARVRPIRITNAGSVAARNVGLRAATGRLVAFCDSDDLWQPRFLEVMAGLWQTEPALKAAYADFRIMLGGTIGLRTKFDDAPHGYWDGMRPLAPGWGVFDHPVVDRVVRWQPFFASAVVVDRQAMLSAGGWDEGVGRTLGDDFGTVLRLTELAPLGVVFEPLVTIRKHPGNFSADVRAMNLGDADVLEYVLRTRPSLADHAPLIRRSVARRRIEALDGAFADGDFDAVRRIRRLLPSRALPLRTRLKVSLARFPPLAGMVGRASTRLRQIGVGRPGARQPSSRAHQPFLSRAD